MENKKKIIIRKSLVRKLLVAKYETLDIRLDIESEIEYSDISELQKKSDNLTKYLSVDYKETEAKILKELNLNPSNAFKNEANVTEPLSLKEKNSLFEEKNNEKFNNSRKMQKKDFDTLEG